jgi:hypothetical protein
MSLFYTPGQFHTSQNLPGRINCILNQMVTKSSFWHEKCLIFIGIFHSTKNRIGRELSDEERYSYLCLDWLCSFFFNFVRSEL